MLLSNPYNPDDRVRNEAITLVELGCEVVILAWDREGIHPLHEVLSGVKINRINLQAGYGQGLNKLLGYLRVWIWYIKEISVIQPAVVHCHDYDTYLVGVWYSLFHRHAKLVLDTHENYYMMMKPLVSRVASGAVQLIEKIFTGFADLLISANDATAEYYRKFGAKKIVLVGNWKNPQVYRFESDVINQKRKELGINAQLVVVYIGALSAERNVIPLLEAVRSRPYVFLILGGKGDQEEEISNICLKMTNVKFPGYIHPDNVPLFTAVADVIFYGFDPEHMYAPYNAPNKLYEALAAGKVVIAGDLGGELTSVVNQTQCGLLLPKVNTDTIGSAIDFLADASVRSSMQERSKTAGLTIYNLSVSQQRLRAAYSSLLGIQSSC